MLIRFNGNSVDGYFCGPPYISFHLERHPWEQTCKFLHAHEQSRTVVSHATSVQVSTIKSMYMSLCRWASNSLFTESDWCLPIGLMLFYTARQRKHSTQKLINTHQLHLQYANVENMCMSSAKAMLRIKFWLPRKNRWLSRICFTDWPLLDCNVYCFFYMFLYVFLYVCMYFCGCLSGVIINDDI